jgi:hypothetical protein
MTEKTNPVQSVVVVDEGGKGEIELIGKMLDDRIAILDRIHTMLQKRIVPQRDLARMGGKFRRNINFARVCRRIVGGDITYRRDPKTDLPYKRTDYKDEQGEFYTYTCSCEWRLPWGETIEGCSLVSSRDPFFGIVDDDFKDPSEVNEAHIAQKSVTEAFKQAVLVGLGFPKDVTDDEMKAYGLDGSAAPGHSFDSAKGNKGGSQATTQESKDKRAELERMCREMFGGGWKKDGMLMNSPEEVLLNVTANPDKGWGGWKNFKNISEKSLGITHSQIKKAYEAFSPDAGGGDGSAPAPEESFD